MGRRRYVDIWIVLVSFGNDSSEVENLTCEASGLPFVIPGSVVNKQT